MQMLVNCEAVLVSEVRSLRKIIMDQIWKPTDEKAVNNYNERKLFTCTL